ncbi:hypothetical protein ZWY2020_019881 [Hordeum vulgare]|nr:hypothetical protein ZWY2020_019881 [Hordeum vulgare]
MSRIALLQAGTMREEEEPSWFALFDEDLPAPDELMPLSQSLITRDLAATFDIPMHGGGPLSRAAEHRRRGDERRGLVGRRVQWRQRGCNDEDPTRTLKRHHLMWTPQLHKRMQRLGNGDGGGGSHDAAPHAL